jgi:hypothetical protein
VSRAAFAAIAVLIAATVPVWAQRATTPPRAVEPVTVLPTEVAPEPMRPAPAPPRGMATTAPVEPVQQTLPSDAQRLITRFENDQAQTRREADAKLAQQRSDVVRLLEAVQDSYAKAGRLDEATAVRDRILAIQSERTAATLSVTSRNYPTTSFDTPASDSLTRFRGQIGASVAVTVTGRTGGAVWGDEIYTDDSPLSTAAVHAGVIRPGETGTVRVTILPGQDSYAGSARHGVRSSEYGEWGGSYRIEGAALSASTPSTRSGRSSPAPTPAAARPKPSESESQPNLTDFRDHVWESFTIAVVGSVHGSVWGSEIYTDDSSIATAAVHAGLLKAGERGTLKVTLLPGQRSYSSSERNGVVTSEYGDWGGSFRLERVK